VRAGENDSVRGDRMDLLTTLQNIFCGIEIEASVTNEDTNIRLIIR